MLSARRASKICTLHILSTDFQIRNVLEGILYTDVDIYDLFQDAFGDVLFIFIFYRLAQTWAF